VSSSNKSEWIQNLIADYKKDLNERKINLDDDYIKFIRYGQHFIDKNGSGILAYISNNSFIDGITHRQMRKSLLESFDKIYILDLHGSSKRSESAPDKRKDVNVFDIMQGVSINIFIKTGKKEKDKLGKVFHFDLFGKREEKYSNLKATKLAELKWNNLDLQKPNFFFVPKDFLFEKKYNSGIDLSELFTVYSTGIESKCDEITIQFDSNSIEKVVDDFLSLSENDLLRKYHRSNSLGWNYSNAKADLMKKKFIVTPISYRPFDIRYTVYTGISGGFLGRPRPEMNNNLLQANLAISSTRSRRNDASCYYITKSITDKSIASSLDNNYIFPLYLYPEITNQQSINATIARMPNLNPEIVNQIATNLGLAFTNEKEEQTEGEVCFMNSPEVRPEFRATFAPIDILDYIYAVLHSPAYREKYKEFLKIDFPRVPYPKDLAAFWKLIALGGELRQIHLLESPVVEKFITQYPVDGNNKVEKIKYEDKKVFINETQYFDHVPAMAWEFYIGGYQPAQKWLKDRKGRELTFDDILHYQKVVVALSETDRIMKEIDKIKIE
jgi:predicted helicase